jgi:hypothetical protein
MLTSYQGRCLHTIHSAQRPSRGQPPCSVEGMKRSPRIFIMYPSEFHVFTITTRSPSMIESLPHIHYEIHYPMDIG